jgi:hypothetical protein
MGITLIGIALIIVSVVGSVHFVHTTSYNSGLKSGIVIGRKQVLEEDIIRGEANKHRMDEEIGLLVGQILRAEEIRYNKLVKRIVSTPSD